MGGALLDLVAKGGQDVYFICNPQMSFFKKVYKKHTNFAVEYQKHQLDGSLSFGKTATFAIPREGDIIKNVLLQIKLPDLKLTDGRDISYVNYIGYAMIDYLELYINNSKIDTITGEWLYIYNELTITENKKKGYNTMVGGKNFLTYDTYTGNQGGTYFVPLNFWFCEDVGSSLPYTALQYSDIEIKIKLKECDKLWVTSDGNKPQEDFKISSIHLCLEKVYLDIKERREFATQSHEYLIKQTQFNLDNHVVANTKIKKFNLPFNHPILELIFVIQTKSKFAPGPDRGFDYFNFSKTDAFPFEDTIKSAKLILNGTDRTPEMTPLELRLYYPLQYHTSIPNNFIYVFPFSLNPEEYQPSGSSNFSRFDIKQLQIEFADNMPACEVKIFAVNYNILRITQGLAGLAYLN